MKCSKAQELIGDLLEGTIGSDDKTRLDEHCEKCPDCREIRTDFGAIAEQAKGLSKFEPAEGLWPRILAGVRADRREKAARKIQTVSWPERLFGRGRPRYAFAAALALLLVVIGGAVVALKPWKTGTGPAPLGGEAYTMAKLEEAESHYKLAIQALTEAVSGQKNGLDPQMAALFEKDLKVIDEAILACRSAVASDPSDVTARVYLLGAYKEKVDFLDNIIDVHKKTAAKGSAEIIL
jgi:tetratricopeptide (TPR) repeat protein